MRLVLSGMVVLAGSCAAAASQITIPLAGDVEVQAVEAVYECDGRHMPVTYINAGSISLAVLAVDGETVIASNVISASGARYAGAQYVWWTKGDEGSLYDLMRGGEDEPVASCVEIS